MNPVAEQFARRKQQAADAYRRHRRPHQFFSELTAAAEAAVTALWQEQFAADSRLCLLASGGFGRGELYPFSDTDLAAAAPSALTEAEEQGLERLVGRMWDCGLMPALQSGSTAQLCAAAQADLTAATAFLEARYLCGNADTAAAFAAAVQNGRDTVSFMQGKLLEMQQRHRRQPALALEPDIKNGIGGLRDIHTMLWLAKVQGIRPDFGEMMHRRIITRSEAGLLIRSHKTLARLRIDLHLAAARAEECLRFDLQSRLAQQRYPHDNAQSGREKLTAAFYRAAKTVLQLNDILIPMLCRRVYSPLPRITADIGGRYYSVGNRLAVKDTAVFRNEPQTVLEIMAVLQSRSDLDGLAPQTLRAWWNAVHAHGSRLYADPANRARFVDFFRHGQGLTRLMRQLNLYGLLSHYLPQWHKIVGLMQHDLFHIYPVDDHILAVLANVRRLAVEEHSHELPFASALMRGFEPKYVLYLAALFHDIAKGRDGDHALLGVEDARRFAADHALPEADAALLCWLVEHHLLMSHTAQKEDFADAAVLSRFCRTAGCLQRLTALYLLTVADIRGTNPKLWNGWKAQLLERLFQAAARHLAGDAPPDPQEQALAALQAHGFDGKTLRRLRSALGEGYFARYDAEEAAWHLPLLADSVEQAQVHIRLCGADMLQVLVLMPNGERLFTRLCRIFSRHRLDIVSARAMVTAHGFILDGFTVRLPEHTLPDDLPALQAALQAELDDFVLRGIFRERGGSQNVSRRARHLPIVPHAAVSTTAAAGWYELEVVAVNRAGLLADITEVFAARAISLKHAKIATTADRVEDSFLIYCPQLSDPLFELDFMRDIVAVLRG